MGQKKKAIDVAYTELFDFRFRIKKEYGGGEIIISGYANIELAIAEFEGKYLGSKDYYSVEQIFDKQGSHKYPDWGSCATEWFIGYSSYFSAHVYILKVMKNDFHVTINGLSEVVTKSIEDAYDYIMDAGLIDKKVNESEEDE